MSEVLGSGDDLTLTIPESGDTSWATSIRDNCFQKITDHRHEGSGDGQKIRGYLGIDFAEAIVPNDTYLAARGATSGIINFIKVDTNDKVVLTATGISGTAIKDEDDMTSDSAEHLVTQQSVKAYVDAQVTAQDLDIAGDTGTDSIDLDSETLTFSGTANETVTAVTTDTVTVGLADNPVIPGTDAVVVPSGTTGQQVSTTAGAFRYNTTDGTFEGYTDSWGSLAGGGGDINQIYGYKAQSDGGKITTHFALGGENVLPNPADTTDVSARFTASATGEALLTNDDADAVYHHTNSASDKQYEFFGGAFPIPAYIRGRDVGLTFQYRTEETTQASEDGDYMVWVWDATNGVNTTTTTTGAVSAGGTIAVVSATGMSVGDKIWFGETGGTDAVVETHITSIATNDITVADAIVNLASGDRVVTGYLTDVLTTINAADSDTYEAGSTYKLNFLPPASCTSVNILIQLLDAEATETKEFFFDAFELSSDPFKSIATIKKSDPVEKILSADITSTQDMSDLTFTHLVVGRRYRLSGNTILTTNGLGDAYVRFHDAASGAGNQIGSNGSGNNASQAAGRLETSACYEFTAQTDSIFCRAVIASATVYGNGTTAETYYTIDEIPTVNQSVVVESITDASENVYSARVANNGTATVTTENSPFIATATQDSTGLVTIVYTTGIFNVTPVVSGTAESNALNFAVENESITGFTYKTWGVVSSESLADADVAFTVMKQGADYTSESDRHKPLLSLPTVTYGQEPEDYICSDSVLYASANTALPYFTTITKNTISNLGTITNDSTSGFLFTATTKCKVTMTHRNSFTASGTLGISKNASASDLDTGIESVTEANVVAQTFSETASGGEHATFAGILEAGDFLAAHVSTGKSTYTVASLQGVTLLVEPIQGVVNQAAIIAQPICYIEDRKTPGTDGGTSTSNVVHTRDLNTLRGDISSVGITLNSNQFTLQAGKYNIYAEAPARLNSGGFFQKLFLYNDTDSKYQIEGRSGYAYLDHNAYTTFEDVITITKETTFDIRHWIGAGISTNGLGRNCDGHASNPLEYERYTQVKITRQK